MEEEKKKFVCKAQYPNVCPFCKEGMCTTEKHCIKKEEQKEVAQ